MTISEELARRNHEFRVYLDAQMWFGEEWAQKATHEERVKRINDMLNTLWREKGGNGCHPHSVQP